MAKAEKSRGQKLTPKQSAFVDEYLVDLNGTQAAIRAGYSERSASRTAGENLNKPLVKAEVERRLAERAERVKVDADYVLNRLKEIDQLDVADILDDDGNFLPVKQWPQTWRQSISGADVVAVKGGDAETLLKKIKWPDKLRNLELLGKHVNVRAFDRDPDEGDSARPIQIEVVNPHGQG